MMPYGVSGVIVTCDGGKEKGALRDVARNLSERWEARGGGGATTSSKAGRGGEDDDGGGGGDAGDALAAELAGLREEAKDPMFKEIGLDLRACSFLKAHKSVLETCSVADLVKDELERAQESGQTRGRHVMRMLPVETVCYAGVEEIAEAAKKLVDKYFSSGLEQTFAISFARRANNTIKRDEVIEAIASMIKQPPNKVNLSDPDLTILVEVMKGVACLAVVRDYERLCKYNLRMVAMTEEERMHAKTVMNGNQVPPVPRSKDSAPKDDEPKEDADEDADGEDVKAPE